MAEIRGFTCDGGCGATTVLDNPFDNLAHQRGWFTTFTPAGFPTLYTCSWPCLIRAAERLEMRDINRALPT